MMPNQDFGESLYYHTAKDALARAKEIERQPLNNETEFGRKKEVATLIVFSALCLEAFINRQYFEGHIEEKGNAKQKWARLPKLLDGGNADFNEGQEPFHTFGQLIDFRNARLIHFHPEAEGNNGWAEVIGDVRLADRFFNCVQEMAEELHRLTNNRTSSSSLFQQKYTRRVSATVIIPI